MEKKKKHFIRCINHHWLWDNFIFFPNFNLLSCFYLVFCRNWLSNVVWLVTVYENGTWLIVNSWFHENKSQTHTCEKSWTLRALQEFTGTVSFSGWTSHYISNTIKTLYYKLRRSKMLLGCIRTWTVRTSNQINDGWCTLKCLASDPPTFALFEALHANCK